MMLDELIAAVKQLTPATENDAYRMRRLLRKLDEAKSTIRQARHFLTPRPAPAIPDALRDWIVARVDLEHGFSYPSVIAKAFKTETGLSIVKNAAYHALAAAGATETRGGFVCRLRALPETENCENENV